MIAGKWSGGRCHRWFGTQSCCHAKDPVTRISWLTRKGKGTGMVFICVAWPDCFSPCRCVCLAWLGFSSAWLSQAKALYVMLNWLCICQAVSGFVSARLSLALYLPGCVWRCICQAVSGVVSARLCLALYLPGCVWRCVYQAVSGVVSGWFGLCIYILYLHG